MMEYMVMIGLVTVVIVVGGTAYWMTRRGKRLMEKASAVAVEGTEARDRHPESSSHEAFIATIPASAEQQIKKALDLFQEALDYSEDSIAKLDALIDRAWPDGLPAQPESTLETFGAYFGEAIRHNLGGEWAYSEEEGYFLDRVGGKTRLYPFLRIEKRFNEGSDESLGFYYTATKEVIEQGA